MSRLLPTFLIIGASKCGTTSLARYLALHPAVFVCRPKEPDFFHPGRGWKRGLDWYESLFDEGRGAAARGEASTCYTWAPHVPGVPERVAQILPEVRLVYLVRDPVGRIRSMYLHNLDRGLESLPLEEAIRRNPLYVDASRYGYQLERYLEHFPRRQILVIPSDRLRNDRAAVVREVLSFIGVEPDVPLEGLEREYQTLASKRRTSSSARALEKLRVPLRRSVLYRHAPRPLKSAMKSIRRLLSRPLRKEDAVFSPDFERRLRESLAPDQERFRKLVPHDFPTWNTVDD